jgi:DNA-binding MarR family transcriptional regulator
VTLDFITIPTAILKLRDLNLREKLLLALVVSFNSKGLRAGNEELSVLLDVWPSRVSRLLKSLEEKGYVRIENPQSRYRVVHLLQSAQVEDVLLAIKRNSRSGALATLSTPTVALSSNTIEELKRTTAHKAKPVCEDGAFDRFWAAYPKKQKKLEAQKIWGKLKPDVELAGQIIKDVQRRKDTFDWTKENRKYCPLPSSYLNGRRWEDEIEATDPDTAPVMRGKDGKTPRERLLEKMEGRP